MWRRTFARCAKDLVHFGIIFSVTLVISAFIGHILIGAEFKNMSSLYDSLFFFHFEILIGEGIGLFSRLFTDRYVVRSGVEKFGQGLADVGLATSPTRTLHPRFLGCFGVL